jgi:hypothetical protein
MLRLGYQVYNFNCTETKLKPIMMTARENFIHRLLLLQVKIDKTNSSPTSRELITVSNNRINREKQLKHRGSQREWY